QLFAVVGGNDREDQLGRLRVRVIRRLRVRARTAADEHDARHDGSGEDGEGSVHDASFGSDGDGRIGSVDGDAKAVHKYGRETSELLQIRSHQSLMMSTIYRMPRPRWTRLPRPRWTRMPRPRSTSSRSSIVDIIHVHCHG